MTEPVARGLACPEGGKEMKVLETEDNKTIMQCENEECYVEKTLNIKIDIP
jgi:hypothetical protein